MEKNIKLELPEKYEKLTEMEMEQIAGGEKYEGDTIKEWLYKLLGRKKS